eukprot:TRINITY_DN14796_c0_g1_i1.p1 TRINITY_DN14796_c0_g1~~TRINITY_DN14796_c0_g1_i1.p1  ORF type:complete len:563 (-),score=64.06 TRINITY_DN14796_c0_g1_i1:907-2595(-)
MDYVGVCQVATCNHMRWSTIGHMTQANCTTAHASPENGTREMTWQHTNASTWQISVDHRLESSWLRFDQSLSSVSPQPHLVSTNKGDIPNRRDRCLSDLLCTNYRPAHCLGFSKSFSAQPSHIGVLQSRHSLSNAPRQLQTANARPSIACQVAPSEARRPAHEAPRPEEPATSPRDSTSNMEWVISKEISRKEPGKPLCNDVSRRDGPAERGASSRDVPLFVFDEKIPRKSGKSQPLQHKEHETEEEGMAAGDGDLMAMKVPTNHRSGYVAIIGRPNAGKSTLLNQLLGQKLSIVTNKPQTTRHRILGISSGKAYQMVLYDTPGFVHGLNGKLDEMMMYNVRRAAVNADCVVLVVDICQEAEMVVDMMGESAAATTENRPHLLVLNKKDLLKPGEVSKKLEWFRENSGANEVMAVSAKLGQNCSDIHKWALSKMPLGPAYYPKDIVSEHPERFFVSEIVREKILLQYHKEIPYVSQVNVVNYIERDGHQKDLVELEIIVERESQKAILVGKEGKALKMLAIAARADIEEFVSRPVYLNILVKVADNWRQNAALLKEYGLGAY